MIGVIRMQTKDLTTLPEHPNLKQQLSYALMEESVIENLSFLEQTLENFHGEKSEFQNVCFKKCRFQDCDFTSSSFIHVLFEDCDLSNSVWNKSFFKDTTFIECKVQGAKFANSSLKNITIKKSKLDYSNFTHALIEAAMVEETSFISTFLSEVKFKKLQLLDCKFDSTDFFKTPLKGIDFSSSEVTHMLMSDDFREIKGAKFNSLQALELAKMLGIIITP